MNDIPTSSNKVVDDQSKANVRPAGGYFRWTSKMLFSDTREVIIEHAGVEYRLRLTSQDKLILTK